MSWVKTDDRYDDTRKIKRAWRRHRATVGLHAMAKSYCARHETDGVIDLDWIEDRLPDDDERKQVIAVMTDVGLLEYLPAEERKRITVTRVKKGKQVKVTVNHGPFPEDVYLVHDYLEFNEARQEAEERRQKDAERKTRERAGRGGSTASHDDDLSGESPRGHNADSERSHADVHAVSTSPDPTRPDPTLTQSLNCPPDPPKGGRARDRGRWRKELDAWVQANPVTDELVAEWDVLKAGMRERHGDPVMMGIDYLHPHQLGDVTVFGSNVGGDPARSLEPDRHGSILRQALSGDFYLIDCQCELTRERAT